jgi:hypothetical protein
MQSIEEKKLRRIISIEAEVSHLHPILKKLLPKLPAIKDVEYTHGTQENGADFVLAKLEPALEVITYVGVIVKCGNIAKAELPSIGSQIEQCEMERCAQGGKKKIAIGEIWVLTNGTISSSAQDFIHHKYATKKIIFVYRDLLIRLIDKHFPAFWSEIDIEAGDYFQSLLDTLRRADRAASLLPDVDTDFYIDQEICRAAEPGYVKFGNTNKGTNKIDVFAEIEASRFVLLEGDAGLGKSRFLRYACTYYCQPINYNATKCIPILSTFKECLEKYSGNLENLVSDALKGCGDLGKGPDDKIVVLLDAADEVKLTTADLVDKLRSIKDFVDRNANYRVLVSSRIVSFDADAKGKIAHIRRIELLPLSMSKVMQFLKVLCSRLSASDRIFEDLKRSQIFRDLPKSPIAAILLAGLLKQNAAHELPSTLPELYSKYFEIVLGRWEENKGLQSQKEYDILDAVLIQIATYIIENELPKISIEEARQFFRDYLVKRNYSLDADEFFNRVCIRHQILNVSESEGHFGFKHRTFAEFLCAKGYQRKASVQITPKIFEIYWLNTFYFYVGIRRDCPEILDQIAALDPKIESQRFMKIFNTANFLMAAYASPYESIKKCVLNSAIEAANLYIDALKPTSVSVFSDLPRMSFLWLVQFMFKRSFGYVFLGKAISEAALELALSDHDDDVKLYGIFLLNVSHLEIGGREQFDLLLTHCGDDLPLDIILGVRHESEDFKRNTLLRKLDQNFSKRMRGNRLLRNEVVNIYEKPMKVNLKGLKN